MSLMRKIQMQSGNEEGRGVDCKRRYASRRNLEVKRTQQRSLRIRATKQSCGPADQVTEKGKERKRGNVSVSANAQDLLTLPPST